MSSLIGRHVLSIEQFNRSELEQLLEVAKILEPVAQRQYRCNALEGAMMANLFFEASTRTRISFHTAFSRLGGHVCDTTGFTFSSLSKGESLQDTARVISGYADTIVMRHPETGSVAQFAEGICVPVINAGDGTGEHPSQALLDYYTIHNEFARLGKTIDGMTIALVGDLKHGRTIHSLCRLLRLFRNITFHFIAPPALAAPPSLLDSLKAAGHHVQEFDSISNGLRGVDIIYATRIQRERIEGGEEMEGYSEDYRINRAAIENYAEKDVVIMHPLPRDGRAGAFDLSTDLDDLPNLAIFRQADNGVTMRMAIFATVLDVHTDIERHFHKWTGFRPRRYSNNDADFYQFN
ncbi:MAG: aspartate carbamoyltransferase [Cardiobacteriaceae bacterium]|nr:aspartate carbamoyltransferase [Cardiobacteriaceae bacterium]